MRLAVGMIIYAWIGIYLTRICTVEVFSPFTNLLVLYQSFPIEFNSAENTNIMFKNVAFITIYFYKMKILPKFSFDLVMIKDRSILAPTQVSDDI